jgi:DNA-binding MarR family transcriptional regulator
MPKSRSREATATRVWRHLFDFIIATAGERNAVLGRYGLTPNDSRALFALAERERTMGSLADAWKCDASYATWLVDRLEKKGLAERKNKEGDRRVKLVGLTARGKKTRAAIQRALYKPPRALFDLDAADLDALERTTRKLHA